MTSRLGITTHFRVTDQALFECWLESLDLRTVSRTVDEYFDTPDLSFYKKDVLIKLENNRILEIGRIAHNKYDTQTVRDQRLQQGRFFVPFDTTQISQLSECLAQAQLKKPHPFLFSYFLNVNGLKSLITFDQTRKTYRNKALPFINILVDELPLLGMFVTFELGSTAYLYSLNNFKSDIACLTKTLPIIPCEKDYMDLAIKSAGIEQHKQKQIDHKNLSVVLR